MPFGDDGSRWASPIGIAVAILLVVLVAWLVVGKQPFIDVRGWWSSARQADLVGAGLLALALGGVILAFATADPEVQVFSPIGPWLLLGSAVASVLFVLHTRRSAAPLIPRDSLRRNPAWGSLVVSFFVGAALIAALVDIPVFARVTVYGDSQVKAALVLVEFLVALPIGALVGGVLTRRLPAGVVTAAGMLLAAVGFVAMSTWGADALRNPGSSLALAGAGFGFGLAIAPVNAALLATTDDTVHGVTSALLVVARMVGMLIGISALTTIGLRRFYAVQGDFPSPAEVCGGATRCDEYERLLQLAGIEQLQAIFLGAAICAAIGGLAALVLFRGAATRSEKLPALGLG